MIKLKSIIILLILLLLFSIQSVTALENDGISLSDSDNDNLSVYTAVTNDEITQDNKIISIDNDVEKLVILDENKNVNANGSQKILSDDSKLALSAEDSIVDSSDESKDLSFIHHTALDFVFSENTVISDKYYKVMGVWNYPYYNAGLDPWIMNDTTWVFCLDNNAGSPDGSQGSAVPKFPSIYQRITLGNDDKFINKYTGKDVLPYLRTLIYLTNDDRFIGNDKMIMGNGKFTLPIHVIYSFTMEDYTNPNSHSNRYSYLGKTIYEYVNELIDIVDSGKGVNNTGYYEGSDFLKYQFYLYVPVSQLNYYDYQVTLGFNILTDINVTKKWDDNDNSENLRQEFINVQLYGNGEKIGSEIRLDTSNNWTYKFTDLPLYYSYNTTLALKNGDFSIKTVTEDVYDFTFKKVWDESYTGYKPNYIYVGVYANDNYLGRIQLPYYRNWEYTVEYFSKYDENGNEIKYTFKDETNYRENKTPTGSIEITKSDDYRVKHFNYQITNDDLKNESWFVEVFNENKYFDVLEVSSSNNWTFSIQNLPEDASESDFSLYYAYNRPRINVIDYEIKEVDVSDKYVSIVENTKELVNPTMPTQDKVTVEYYKYLADQINLLLKNTTITNKLYVTEVNVTKIWNDDNNRDGVRPDSITVYLLADGKKVDSVQINSTNWNYTFKKLPKYINGSLVRYSIGEISVNNYSVVITNSDSCNFTITNTHTPLMTSVNVTKVWNDANNQKGLRSDKVIIYLFADGIMVDKAVLSDANGWKFTFSNLPVNKDGNKIVYTIIEGEVADYKVSISDDNGNFIVTNTYIRPDLNVVKIANDKTVYVGKVTSFTIIVTNTGSCNLTGVYVIDRDYSNGLKYRSYDDRTGKWIFDGVDKWYLVGVLEPGKSASFIVYFDVLKTGILVNNVTAGSDITNETNSTNSTKAVNKTNETKIPKKHVPDIPKRNIVEVPVSNNTAGNPIFALIMMLITLVFVSKRKYN